MHRGTSAAATSRMAFVRGAIGVVAAMAIAGAACTARGVEPSQDGRGILRYDPLRDGPRVPVADTLVAVPEDEAKAGCVYNHFSERLNRRVWAIRKADGQFSHALGEGTTQSAPSLDVRGDSQERREKLAQANRELLRQLEREGGVAYFRLTQDNRWQLDPTASHPTVYDAETNNRWEWINGRYIPISSAPFAYQWRVVNGQYAPMDDVSCPEIGSGFPVSQIDAMPERKCSCGN